MKSDSAEPIADPASRANYSAAAFFAVLAAALWLLPWITSPVGCLGHDEVWGGDFARNKPGHGQRFLSLAAAISGEGYVRQFLGVPHPFDDSSEARLHKYLTGGFTGLLAVFVVAGGGSWLLRGAMAAGLAIATPLWTLIAESFVSQLWLDRQFPNFRFETAYAVAAETAIWAATLFGLTLVMMELSQCDRRLRFGPRATAGDQTLVQHSIAEFMLLTGVVAALTAAWLQIAGSDAQWGGVVRTSDYVIAALKIGARQGVIHLLLQAWLQVPLIWGAIYVGTRYALPNGSLMIHTGWITYLLFCAECQLAHDSASSHCHFLLAVLIEFFFIVLVIGALQSADWFGLESDDRETVFEQDSGRKRIQETASEIVEPALAE